MKKTSFLYRSLLTLQVLSCLLPLASLSYAESLEQRLTETIQLLPVGASVSWVIQPLGRDDQGIQSMASNGDKLVPPASTLKIITAIAAYYQLGKDFEFTTQLLKEPDGDWVLVFSGDPLLDRSELKKLLQQTKGQGVTHILGDFILDGSIFNGHLWSTAQSWDDRPICFAAPAAALNLQSNCVHGLLYRDQLGAIARPYIPNHEPLNIISQVRVVTAEDKKRRFCDLELTHDSHNNYKLSGCVVQSDQPMPLALAIVDPDSYVKEIIRYEASLLNIVIQGDIRMGSASGEAVLLAEHRSPTLDRYLAKMLGESNNLIADVLFKRVGHSYFNYPSNYRSSAAAVRQILHEQANIDLGNAYIADGSGLSRYNLLSPSILIQAINHIAAMNDHTLIDALAVSGVNGTLKDGRYGLSKAPLKNAIRAKTGHLKGVYNLAGFIETAGGEQLAFVMFVDGYNQPKDDSEASNGLPKDHAINTFYRRFFTVLYDHDQEREAL